MELLCGHVQRSMLMRLPVRNYLISGCGFSIRKLPISRIGRFHGSIHSKPSHEQHTSLTLASLGFEDRFENFSEEGIGRIVKPTSSMEALREDIAMKATRQNPPDNGSETIPIPENIESKLSKKIKGNKLAEMAPSESVPTRKGKATGVAANSKMGTLRREIDMDASIFSAKSFGEFDLSPLLVKQLEGAGLAVPTEVQSTAIPMISRKRDVVMQSYTGSGKTLAYLLPILSEVGPLRRAKEGEEPNKSHGIEAVIVAPSRELGMQIVREAERLLAPADRKLVQQLVGGTNRSRQEEALKKNKPVIVVGTPGRIADISAAGKLHTHSCRFLVLDEVDQLLSFTFRESMRRILEHVGRKAGAPPSNDDNQLARRMERQLIMVSATMPFSVIRAATGWARDPVLVKAKTVVPVEMISSPKGPTLGMESGQASTSTSATKVAEAAAAAADSLPPGLKHYYCTSKTQHSVDTLRKCVHALEAKSVIVFLNHFKQLKDVVFKLEARGVKAASLHGNLGKLERSTTLKNFRCGEVRVLVTNELSARGLDVFECDLVVNLELPTDSVHYAHRAGRTGRLGQKGTVVTICEESLVFVVKKLSRQLGLSIQACEFAEGKLVPCNEEG